MKLIFISGPSGSGKTTLSNQIIKKNKNKFIIEKNADIDNILKKLFN